MPRVGVQFEIDANGILHVLARDTKTAGEKIVEMKSAVDVDDAAVQKMVEESVEHAFDDLAARRWIEAKLKANETLAATRKAIADFGGEIENARRAKSNPPRVPWKLRWPRKIPTGSAILKIYRHRSPRWMKPRPLADLLMDKAMEAMLRKRGLIQ